MDSTEKNGAGGSRADDRQPFMPLARGASADDVGRARQEIERLKTEYGLLEPDRGDLSDASIRWRDGVPNYTVSNLVYMRGKTKNHAAGSLELVVENMVKTWEMEATHKPYDQWTTVNHDKYHVQANGGRLFSGVESGAIGNYNWLLSTCRKDLYDCEKENFESSHEIFLKAFPHGFPWEVLKVYSGPPKVAFTWRHWANFTGEYEGKKGDGELVNMTGFGIVTLDEMKVSKIEIYYNPELFIEVLRGNKDIAELKSSGAAFGDPIVRGCPFAAAANGLNK